MNRKRTYIFGPVPSRRLGYSLGVDIIPFKTCNLNCVYCELGRTTKQTMKRLEYVPTDFVIDEVREAIRATKRIDYITFSGSGEPTLNSKIGEMIAGIKTITDIPIAVLTNGTLLYLPEVQQALRDADLVLPSLDAASQTVFSRINRPHGDLQIDTIIEGLVAFRRKHGRQMWLEILFVRDINDRPAEIDRLCRAVARIKPNKIQLNTVVRPAAESNVQPLSLEALQQIRAKFGERAEVIASFQAAEQEAYRKNIEADILALTARRPVTVDDIAGSLGYHRDEVIKYLSSLVNSGKIVARQHDGRTYYLNFAP